MGKDIGPIPPNPLRLGRLLFLSATVLYFSGLTNADSEVASVIAAEVLKISLEQFEGDDVLIQKFDSGSTQFWHPNNGIEPVYERKGENSEDVLVLSKDEDKLDSGKSHSTKQSYVVLRRKDADKFYPLFAYLRNARPNEACPIAGPTSQLCIEWDSWETRVVEEPSIWLDCSSQVFLSCGFNNSVFEKDQSFKSILTTDLDAEGSLLTGTGNTEPEVEPEVDDNLDIINSTDYDFFDDLHGVRKQGIMGRSMDGKKKKVQPRQDGKLYDLCLDANLRDSPNCFNGLGLSLDLPHPLQYSRPSSSNLNMKGSPLNNGKPNYKNYQPIGTVTMAPYRKGITFGTFTPEDSTLKVVKGSMYVFGPGSLDVFKADFATFGTGLPDNQGTVGTYSSCKITDPTCMIHGVLIPLDSKTAYMIRSGLAYPASFKTTTGIPKTRGFVVPLENKQIDLFYPDSFVTNNLRLNNPLEKPMSGSIDPHALWAKLFPEKNGLLFPRKWVASIFIRQERPFEYTKFTQLDGFLPSVRVAVTPGQNGLPDEFYSLEEPLLPPHKIPINLAFLGTVTFGSGSTKNVPVYAIPSARHGEVDKFIPSDMYYLERVAINSPAGKMTNVKTLMRILQANKGEPITGQTVEVYLYRVDLKAPGIHEATLIREDGSKEEGTLYVDKTVNPLKFTAKNKASTGPKGPASSGPTLTPVSPTATAQPKPPKNPKKATPTKPGELRYPTYKNIGTLAEPVRYQVGYETGSFKPDDKTLEPISVKAYILGMDKPDMLQGNKQMFGTIYPIDKGVAGTYVPNNPNPTHEIHGVLIPLNENTGVIFRDGLGYPCSYKIKSGSPAKEILGFYAPSMRKQTEFFYPESFITFKELSLPYHVPIEGKVVAEEPLLTEVGEIDGQLLPREDGVASVFIRGTINKFPGTFQDADGKLPPAKLIVIPGKEVKPDEFYPLDGTQLDSKLPVNGTVTTDPATIPRRATFVRTPNDGTPDIFVPLEGFDVQPIKFHVLKRKLEPLTGVVIAPIGVRIPPRVPVDLVFDTLHQQPVPSRLLGNLETQDEVPTRGNIIVNLPDGQLTFFPDVREVPKEELAPGYAPDASQKYNKYVPYGKADTPNEVVSGVTIGNFVPDTDNNGKAIRISVHTNGPFLLDSVECEDPVFGRELPEDRGVPGTYTAETRKGKKKDPIHGILIPVDKNRAFFLLDGTGFYGAFEIPSNPDARPIQGFIVPVKGTSDRFYFESYITFTTVIREPTVNGRIVPDKSVKDKYPAQDIMLILKRSEPSIIIPLDANPEEGTFTPDDSKRKPIKMIVVPKKDGNPDEFFPLDDDEDPGTDPLPGSVKSPTKDARGTLIPNLLPGASDEFIPEDDPEPSDLIPVTITSTESNLNDIKAFIRLPKGEKGPPTKPTPLFVTEGIQIVPTRLQATMKMPDDSAVVGLLAADSPTGPFTFYPGASNPLPSSLKLMPRYDDVITNSEPTDVPTIPTAPEEVKMPVPVSTHRGYPSYVPIGKSDEKIVMKLGATLGNFVPDEENERHPLRIAVVVVGPKNLDSVESEKPIFGQELPEDRGTEGTYTPDEKDGIPGTPIHGILIPIDPTHGYFLRNGIGYEGKFTPKDNIAPTWGFVIPSQPGIRTADHFYPESFVTYNLKGKPRLDGELEPDKNVQDLYKTRPAELLTRRVEPNILLFKGVGAIDGTFQDDAKAKAPKKLVVVPESQGNPDEFYPLDDDDDQGPKNGKPVKGTIKAKGLEKAATMLPNPIPGAPDVFIPEEEEIEPVTIESAEVSPLESPLDTVKAFATLPPDQKGPITAPTEVSVTQGADKLPSRLQAKLTIPNKEPVEGLLVADTPNGPFTFFPGMQNPEATQPKPLEVTAPEEPKKEDPRKSKPKQKEPPQETGRSDAKKPVPTILQGDSEDEEESTSTEQVAPELKKCSAVPNDYPTFGQYGTSTSAVEYNIGVTPGVFVTEDGKSLPVVVHVVGVDNLDVLESEDPIFGSKLPDDMGTVGTFTPDNPKSGAIRGVVLPVTSHKAYIVRDGTAYISTFHAENDKTPPVLGFRAPSMIKNREADFFYPQAFACAIIDSPVKGGEMVPHQSVEQFFPKTKGKLILNPWGNSIFIPDTVNAVEGSFQDDGSAHPPSKVLVIPETSRKPNEFYPIENVLQNGELTPGKITTPEKELKVNAVARPSKQGPDFFYPEEETVEVVTLISKDQSIPKQKAVILWKVKPKGPPKSAVKVVPLTKTLTLPFKVEVTVLMDDGTFINGLLAQNGVKDSYTLYPFMKDPMPTTPTQSAEDGARKPGSETKYPKYVQFGTSDEPIEYLTGVSAGNVVPDETPEKRYPAVVSVEGVGKLDLVEFQDPVFGTELPSDKGTLVTFTPTNSQRGNPLRGVLIPLDPKKAYLIRDALAYTCIFVPHKNKFKPIEGFLFQNSDKTKETQPFIPETLVGANADDLKGILDGILVPDAETAKFFPDTPGKLVTTKKKPYTFIPSKVKVVEGEFQDADKKNPPKKVLVVPGINGDSDEFYPLDDDLLPEDTVAPVKGSVTTPDKVTDVVVIPNKIPGTPDKIVPEEVAEVAEVTVTTPDDNVKAQMVRPKGEKGRPKKPVELTINEGLDKLKPREEGTLNLDDGTKVPGLLVANPEAGSATFFPGVQDTLAPTAVMAKEPAPEDASKDKTKKPKPSTSKDESPSEPKEEVKKPVATKYPTYVMYGQSDAPIEYRPGGTVGTFSPEDPKREPLPATVFVFGVDKLDIIQFDDPIFGDVLPEKTATVGVYNPEGNTQKPIRGVVIPIDERRGYILRDGIAYAAIFYPKKKESVPSEIVGFLIRPLSGDADTELFVAESYITYKEPLSKQNQLPGNMVPSTEASVFFPPTSGKLLTRGQEPSIYIPDSVEIVPGTFQDETLLHPPIKVNVVPAKEGSTNPDQIYPGEDEIPEKENIMKGTVTTPWKMIPVSVVPSGSPKIPPQIVITDEKLPEPVTFEKTPGPVKAYLLQDNDNSGCPTKSTDVVLTKPEDETLPISQEVNLILGDGKNRTGLLVAKTPGGVYQVFFPGALQPSKQPKVKQVAEAEPEEKPSATDPGRKGDPPTEAKKRPRKSGLYPTYIIHTPDGATLEYFIGATEGTFITDDNPPKSLPVTLNVLGADKLDVIVSTTPIFGSQLPIDTGIAGTFKPTTGGPGPKNPQRSIHGVILPVDESTALVIRDGLAFPVTLYLPESKKDTHGFFVPLLRRPIEVFYPDSIKTFEPIVADVIAASPSNLVPAEIVPDQEIDRLAFPDSKGQIDLNRKGRNRYISDQFPDKTVVFKDDEGKVSINFKLMEGSGDVPNEYIAVDKDLPQITDVARGTLTDPDGSSPAAPNDRAAVLSLPKAADGDVTEYEVYPEHMFTIREVQVTSRDKKLKNVEGYVITSKNAKDGTPVDIIFKTFKASLTEPKHSVTVSFVDDSSVVRGMLFTNHISGPHTFFPAGGKMQYNSNEPTFEMEGPKSPDAKQKENAAEPASPAAPATTPNSKPAKEPSKPEQSRSEPVDNAKPKAPVDSVKPKAVKLKTPTPVFAEDNDDWPFNMVYEPTEDNKEASIPEDKKPDKAIQAIILPMDGQNKKLFAVKGKIPTSTPERGKPLIFLPYKIEEAKINYFRGTLRMPGDPAGDLEGRFRAPKRASTPPVFIVDPLGSDPAVFVANNNPRVEVYGYVISTNGDFRFQPDESIHVPTQPTPGILRISEKQNKVGVLMTPLTPDDLCEFRTDSPKTANTNSNDKSKPTEVYFYPDLDTFKPIKGTVTVIGDKMSFVPDPTATIDKSALPLHGLVVSPTDVIASVFGFIYPAPSDGEPYAFKNDKPGSVLTDFRPDNSEDTLIRGVFIPSKTEHEAAGQFIVSGATIKVPFNQLGILNKKNTQGQPAIGMLTEKNGKIYFDADDRICIEVTFYPDVVNSQPTQGLYIFSKGGPSGEFRPTIGEVILVSLPVDGQIVPKADTHPQVHGTLKQSPNGAAEYDFEEDPPNTPPDNAVDLVGSKDGPDGGAGNGGDSGLSVEIVYIWGMYFVGIGNINIFIPRAGATGTLVANDRPPTDPNAIKFEGLLTTHEPKTACSGATYYATFIPDYNGRSNNLAAEFPSTIQIVFYPAGSISGGIVGTVIQKDENQWLFIVVTSPKEGRWRPPPGVNQFTYDEAGQIIAYDQTMIWFRQQERDKTAGVKIKGGYYKGTAGVNVIVPEAFKSGAMFIISGENKLHGKVYPLDKGKVIKFIPDDEPTAYTKVKEADNKLSGLLDLDESLSVNGKTPDNGIPGSLKLNEMDEFIITPDTKGQWGYFIPGKKPLPMMVVMCFTTTVTGIAGRSMDDGSDQEEGKCSDVKHTYYVHEKDGYVLQICHRAKKADEASVEQRIGYYPYSEAGEDDSADDSENARSGIAFPMNTGAHIFVSSDGIEGDFLMLEAGKVAIDMDSLSNVSGKIFYMPDNKHLMFKPTQLNVLLEEAKSNPDGVKGFFKSKLGVAQEGLLYATLRLNGKGVSGVLTIDKPGEFGIVYLTDNEPVVAGSIVSGRTFLAEKHAEVGKAHGVLYETGGTGTFLEGHGDVSGIFMYTTADGKDANQTVHLHPELGLLYSPSSFTAEFRKTVKATTTLPGKLYIPDEHATIPASLTKSQQAPMAYVFTPGIPFRVGWLSSRKTEEGVEVFFMDDNSIDVFQHPGWKTQYLTIEPGVTASVDKLIFHGLGNCPSDTRTTVADYKKSLDTNDKLIKFFVRVLRTHCLKPHTQQIKRLVNTGILEVFQETNGKILRMKADNKILSAEKLRKRETEDLSAAFSMAILSETYVEQLFDKNASLKPTGLDGNPISRSAHFFHKMVMMAIKRSKEILRPHFVRLMRNMITTLNTAVAKLDQDKDRLAGCRGCGDDLLVVINDKIYLTALSQFITHSVRYSNDKDPDKSFRTYYKANKISISKLASKKIRINNQ